MNNRSKSGIFKPKVFYRVLSDGESEPATIVVALQSPKWFQAMIEKYKAVFQKSHMGTCSIHS